jgi:hypothetical protein
VIAFAVAGAGKDLPPVCMRVHAGRIMFPPHVIWRMHKRHCGLTPEHVDVMAGHFKEVRVCVSSWDSCEPPCIDSCCRSEVGGHTLLGSWPAAAPCCWSVHAVGVAYWVKPGILEAASLCRCRYRGAVAGYAPASLLPSRQLL